MKILSPYSFGILSVVFLFPNGWNGTVPYIIDSVPKTTTEVTACACNPMNDSLALVALYNSAGGAGWTNPWVLTQPMNTWQGVLLDGSGCVGKLWLESRQLNGHIPPEIGNFSELDDLVLSKNQLSSSIPPEISNLGSLTRIDLHDNQLSGNIPPELANLENLEQLILYKNQLSGNIPPELSNLSNLWWLDLYSNQLTGNIPPELGSLSNLQYLALSQNELIGSIPPVLGDLLNMKHMVLNSNQLSGNIPPELGNLGNLEALFLDDNELNGAIPPELGNLPNLQTLYLSANQLSGNIPPELGNLTNLRWLRLNANHLSGKIPSELGNLTKLAELHLEINELSGHIPAELGNLGNLTLFWLHINQLSGSIPPELGNLSHVTWFRLDYNQLCGNIPPELSNLNSVAFLHLSTNQLSGSIPPELGSISSLVGLYLEDNHLSCNIPAELGNLSNLQALDLHGNQLTGCLPPALLDLCPGVGNEGDISGNPNLETFSWVNFCNNNEGLCDTPQPSIALASNHPLCEGESIVLTETGGSGANWSWEGPNGFVSNQQNPVIPNATVLSSGDYFVTVTDGNGFTSSCLITVEVHPLPIVDLGNDTTIIAPDTYLLDAGNGFSAYAWSDGSTLPILIVTEAGEYSVTVTDVNGCKDSDEVTVQVLVRTKEAFGGGYLSLFPNPASAAVNVRFEQFHSGSYSVDILDLLGRIVRSHPVAVKTSDQTLKLRLDDVAKGIYFLYVSDGSEKALMGKLVVE
jgi:Leucine-rich repeat (LRR) protein